MATDFGFIPSNADESYFISYNSEDSSRVGTIARELNAQGLPIWYDYGLEYGAEWECQIASHIRRCKAVIMFITKKIFDKEKSYVRKDYEMAVDYYYKKVYVVMLDSIDKRDIPEQFLGWWIDLNHLHCITNSTSYEIMRALGYNTSASADSNSLAEMGAEDLFEKGCDYYCDQNYTEAAKCYKIAAEQGHPDAQYCLGLCYYDGEGVEQNYAEAVRYFKLAAEQELNEAINKLKELGIRIPD